ncbi:MULTISPECIES: response regulator transcription factor [Cysteiniphilum]|uniref:response regulator transcription factor n=1 Tax=Cysteiniphilum TaxID=2056696 RepID=UPI0017856C3B|nr:MULTISPECIES: response regulator transcription factor [Cysteiniphilum]
MAVYALKENDQPSILIIEDDQKLNHIMKEFLSDEGFKVAQAFTGDEGINLSLTLDPDVILLDLMLPNISGMQVYQAIRHSYRGVVIMLTARDDDESEIEGLKLGVNDYLRKPVKPEILLLRIKKLLRENIAVMTSENELVFGSLVINKTTLEVYLNNEKLEMPQSDISLLILLAEHADQLLTRDQIYQEIKGIPYDGIDRSIDTKISHIRRKLGDDPQTPFKIKTIWGKGYIFISTAW